MSNDYPRDMAGYGRNPPDAHWPGGARLALSFVLNYEEGGEQCVLHGDPCSESFLSDMVGAQARDGVRHMSMESLYEYGSRAGVWRLQRLFSRFRVPITVFAVGMAVERNPAAVIALHEDGHEICSHGYRWIDYQYVDRDTEREHIQQAIRAIENATGARPLGWYTGRTSPNTIELVAEEGGFIYHSDDYSDDLPFWDHRCDHRLLAIPYTLDANDMRYATAQRFNSGEQFFGYLRDTFDVLYAEGKDCPKMMSVGLHCRLAGRPGRFAALQRFVEYVKSHEQVWFARRVDIARHWRKQHPSPVAERL